MKLALQLEPSPEILERISQGVTDYAQEMRGLPPIEPFAIPLEDENGKLVGGCHGITYYGCIYMDALWIGESHRHQGWGRQLVQQMEAYGVRKGCTFATVNTMDWEALPFYEKLGYTIEFVRGGYPKNSKLYFLRNDF
ncbi:MAG: GNAT family N-acetyltransferase [Holosporales bacterium]